MHQCVLSLPSASASFYCASETMKLKEKSNGEGLSFLSLQFYELRVEQSQEMQETSRNLEIFLFFIYLFIYWPLGGRRNKLLKQN